MSIFSHILLIVSYEKILDNGIMLIMKAQKPRILIVYNDYFKSDGALYCIGKFYNNCINKGLDPIIKSGQEVAAQPNYIHTIKPAFVIMRDKFPNLAKHIELSGIPVINSSDTIRVCDDKAEMSITLSSHSIPRPLTLVSPETYGKPIGTEFINMVAEFISFPIVIKKTHSSYGMGVFLVNTMDELLKWSDYSNKLVFEQFVPVPFGQDIRVFVVGEKIVGAIKRIGRTGDFRSNIELGGSGYPYEPEDIISKLALSSTKAVGAYYGGVDIINSDNPVVLEVNASAGFKCMDTINNMNTAGLILDYAIERFL